MENGQWLFGSHRLFVFVLRWAMVGLWRVLLPQLHKAPVHENCCKSLACHFFDVRLLFHAVVWAEPQGPHMPKKLRSEAGKCRKANSKSSSTKCHEHQRNLGATAPCPASRCLESGISGPSIQKCRDIWQSDLQ